MTTPVPFSSPPLAVTNPVMFTEKTTQIPMPIDYTELPASVPKKDPVRWSHEARSVSSLVELWSKTPETAPKNLYLEPSKVPLFEYELHRFGWTFTIEDHSDGEKCFTIVPPGKPQE